MLDPSKQFTLVRALPATRQQVWDAWTDPDEMAGWLHPDGLRTPRDSVAADVRVGGRYRYTMVHDATGESYPTGGEFLEVDEPRRLVMSWGHPEDAVDDAMRLTIDLEDLGGTTRMTFLCQGVEAAPGDGNVYDGWDQALALLAAHVGGAR